MQQLSSRGSPAALQYPTPRGGLCWRGLQPCDGPRTGYGSGHACGVGCGPYSRSGLDTRSRRYHTVVWFLPKPGNDLDTMRVVAEAYRQVRQAGRLDQLAREAATAALLVRPPEIDRRPASKAVGQIIAWAAQKHPDWCWKGFRLHERR